jgi:hypothetical protein
VFYTYVKDRGSNEAELYQLENDIGESRNVAKENPEVVERMMALAKSFSWPEKLFDPAIGLPGEGGAPKNPKKKAE